MSVTKDYSQVISKLNASQYFVQYKNDVKFVFTTNIDQILKYVQSKVPSQNTGSFSMVISGLSDDRVQKIGDFTVVKTKDCGKYKSGGV
jgi:hypothetical protein